MIEDLLTHCTTQSNVYILCAIARTVEIRNQWQEIHKAEENGPVISISTFTVSLLLVFTLVITVNYAQLHETKPEPQPIHNPNPI